MGDFSRPREETFDCALDLFRRCHFALDSVTESLFHTYLTRAVLAVAALVFVSLFFIVAPYGRHTRPGWGVMISNRLGWALMESPSVVVFAVVYALGQNARSPMPLALATLWLTHYVHRAFIYPFRLRDAKKPMPVAIATMAITFNHINSYLNARWISELGRYELDDFARPHFILGVLGFVGGMALNIRSDNILFSLRKPGDEGYLIPEGGAFRWVSSPNYLGELVEWGSWALASWSLAGLSFFLFTFANLLPRALSNHRWYRKTFGDYPPRRRAIIPYLL